MNQVKFFENSEFGTIRTICNACGEVLFCAKDVSEALGYKRSRNAVARFVHPKDVSKQGVPTGGGRQMATFVNESGLYALILSSTLKKANRFKRWVTGDVLPAIRQDGGYMMVRPDDSKESVMARTLLVMQKTVERRDALISQLTPRAEYADEVLDSVSCFTTTQIAKELNMTAMELNRLLRCLGVQYHQSGQYLLYAPYARMGYAKSRTFGYPITSGVLRTRTFLVWTERGRRFIHQLLKEVA